MDNFGGIMFRFHNIIVLIQAFRVIYPLLLKGRRLPLPLLFKEIAILAAANSDLVWKFLESRSIPRETIQKFFNFIKK